MGQKNYHLSIDPLLDLTNFLQVNSKTIGGYRPMNIL